MLLYGMTFRNRCGAAFTFVILSALAAACAEIAALPAGSENFVPPPEYQLWWSMTEACSGLRGSLADVDWYVVPNATYIPGSSRELGGEWYERGNRIIVASGDQFDGSLVRHEMLHALTRANHTRLQFLERCGGVVMCVDTCITDSGPPPTPPAGTPHVSPSDIDVDVDIEPATPSGGQFGGYFTIVVTARNPATHAVVVDLPASGDDGPSETFTFSMRSGSQSSGYYDRAYDADDLDFAAGETKRDVFDLHLARDPVQGGLAAGTYTANGAYGEHGSAPKTVTLSP